MPRKERRRAARAPAKLAMEIKLRGKDLTQAESINVSANGVYFSSPHFIEPLTRLAITLSLPSDGLIVPLHEVSCEGVVVRVEPEAPRKGHDAYRVACYFTSISEKDREALESYILNLLAL